ncbi:MAG: hypothetical protein ACI9G1_003729, partial [Pirellulaceae bacterium]
MIPLLTSSELLTAWYHNGYLKIPQDMVDENADLLRPAYQSPPRP